MRWTIEIEAPPDNHTTPAMVKAVIEALGLELLALRPGAVGKDIAVSIDSEADPKAVAETMERAFRKIREYGGKAAPPTAS